MDSVDALVIGRKTYETVLGFDAWPYGEKPVFVLSTRSLPRAPANAVVEHLSGDPAQIMADLDARGIKHGLRRWRYNHSEVSVRWADSATHYHACSSADWGWRPPFRSIAPRCTSCTCCDSTLSQRF